MPDRCPHRGAALSLGRVNQTGGSLACPFHGLEFGADGRCVNIPVEPDARIPENFGLQSLPVTEADGFIWLWRGAAIDSAARPPVPVHPAVKSMHFGESVGEWNAHYTRCIENVCDFSHLPFVHKTTIGMLNRQPAVKIDIEDVPGGFRAHLLKDGQRNQCLEFLYPNRWLLMLSPRMMLALAFAPIDDNRTAVYGRTYHRLPLPQWLMNGYNRFSQFLVFREDWPIVGSQSPGNILDAREEKLLPSDAPVIAYRKLHRAFMAAHPAGSDAEES
jgi:phenylpropionate dioxygenase-like ring-hydroxylating dioxygenase large terminal subunit